MTKGLTKLTGARVGLDVWENLNPVIFSLFEPKTTEENKKSDLAKITHRLPTVTCKSWKSKQCRLIETFNHH